MAYADPLRFHGVVIPENVTVLDGVEQLQDEKVLRDCVRLQAYGVRRSEQWNERRCEKSTAMRIDFKNSIKYAIMVIDIILLGITILSK